MTNKILNYVIYLVTILLCLSFIGGLITDFNLNGQIGNIPIGNPNQSTDSFSNPQYFWVDYPYQLSFRSGDVCWFNFTPYFAGEIPIMWELCYNSNGSRILNGTFINSTVISRDISQNFTVEGFYYTSLIFYTSEHSFSNSMTIDVKSRPEGQYFFTNDPHIESQIFLNQTYEMEWIAYFSEYTAQGWELYTGLFKENEPIHHELSNNGEFYDGIPFYINTRGIFNTSGNYELILQFKTGEDQVFAYYLYFEVSTEEIPEFFEVINTPNLNFHLGNIQILDYTPHFSNYTPWRFELTDINSQTILEMGSYVNDGKIEFNITEWFEYTGNYSLKMTFFIKENRFFSVNTSIEVLEACPFLEFGDFLSNITIDVGSPLSINLNLSNFEDLVSITTNDSLHISVDNTGKIENVSIWEVGTFDFQIYIEDKCGEILIIDITVYVLNNLTCTDTQSTTTTLMDDTNATSTTNSSEPSDTDNQNSKNNPEPLNIPGFSIEILCSLSFITLYIIKSKKKLK